MFLASVDGYFSFNFNFKVTLMSSQKFTGNQRVLYPFNGELRCGHATLESLGEVKVGVKIKHIIVIKKYLHLSCVGFYVRTLYSLSPGCFFLKFCFLENRIKYIVHLENL